MAGTFKGKQQLINSLESVTTTIFFHSEVSQGHSKPKCRCFVSLNWRRWSGSKRRGGECKGLTGMCLQDLFTNVCNLKYVVGNL